MGYSRALDIAWDQLRGLTGDRLLQVRLLSDAYNIDLEEKRVLSLSCNTPAKDHTSIILLHYLIRRFQLNPIPQPLGEWIDFNRLEGGEGYYPAFKKRTVDHLVTKFGRDQQGLLHSASRFNPEKSGHGDLGLIFRPLDNVPILITMSSADDEFGPDAAILFDKGISRILCTEDIVVLTETLVHKL